MTASKWPRITIITPSFNQGEFIEETIKSILNQNYPNLEYFVVDGGSTDNTLDIIRKYEDKIDWWVSEPDRGQSHAINKGLARATGEIINFINSDDVLFPGALRRVAQCYLKYCGKVGLIVGANARISPEGKILRISSPPSRLALAPRSSIIPIGQPSTFFTRTAVKITGGFREDLHATMDRDFYRRVLEMGGKIVRLKALVGAIRNHQRAKGCAQTELWRQESPELLAENLPCALIRKLELLKMKLVKTIDGSYLRGFWFTLLYRDKTLTGKGWA